MIRFIEGGGAMLIANQPLIGSLFFLGSVQFILAIIIAESRYRGYNVGKNAISDLGVGGTARVFNASIIIFGVAIVCGALFAYSSFGVVFTLFVVLSGLGAIGVGVFPETRLRPHVVCALAAFVFGALSAIFASPLEGAPFGYFSAALGLVSLAALLLLRHRPLHAYLGFGGIERLVAYPILFWALAFGGFLLGSG